MNEANEATFTRVSAARTTKDGRLVDDSHFGAMYRGREIFRSFVAGEVRDFVRSFNVRHGRCPECGSRHVTTNPGRDYPDFTAPTLKAGEAHCVNCGRVVQSSRVWPEL